MSALQQQMAIIGLDILMAIALAGLWVFVLERGDQYGDK